MALKPHWADEVIDGVIREDNPNAIARALVHSDRVLDAIKQGMRNFDEQPKGAIGPTRAQYIRQALQEVFASDD